MKTLIILLVTVVQIFGHGNVRYDNYQVYRVVPRDQRSLELLKHLEHQSDFSFWTSVKTINHNVDVMVPPYGIDKFEKIIRYYGLDTKMIIPNVQNLIDNERRKVNNVEEDFGWTDYYTLEKINVWLSNLAEKYSDNVTLVKGGTSYEGRDIVGVRVSFTPGNENRSVFVEGNIHAREWITSAVVTYVIDQLLTNTDPEVRQVAESHDWYIFPVINPDGFAYTHTTDRLWRKTRVPYGDCVGVDANRNWGYHFNEGGTSDDPCSSMYCGPEAFSEPSMKSLSEYISTIGDNLEGYISFHSYSQVLLIPYGYTTEHLDNFDELYDVGVKAIDALSQRYGTKYQVGSFPDLMYIASGNSPDWVKGTFGTRITYTYELRDTGEYGFVLPADQILPTAEETFDSFVTIFKEFGKIP